MPPKTRAEGKRAGGEVHDAAAADAPAASPALNPDASLGLTDSADLNSYPSAPADRCTTRSISAPSAV
jgi:hypothetical protein